MPTSMGEVFARNREAFIMARGSAGIGGPAGSNPIGDRPGTTTLAAKGRAWETPMGRAHVFALGAFVAIVALHLAAESRT